MNGRELPLLHDANAKKILEQLCEEHRISLSLLRDLIDIQRDNLGKGRQMGITSDFHAVISEFLEQQKDSENVSK